MGRPERLPMRGFSCFARHTWLRTLAEDLSTRPHRSIPSQGRKNLSYPVYYASSFKWLRLKALTMISEKLHVFWRRTMLIGSLFYLCYKTPQQYDYQETMTSNLHLAWEIPLSLRHLFRRIL